MNIREPEFICMKGGLYNLWNFAYLFRRYFFVYELRNKSVSQGLLFWKKFLVMPPVKARSEVFSAKNF